MSDPVRNYSDPKKLCDLIMKGGITSGVVYPQGISEIAKHYSLKNIGGASAGAIAAAAAAAAEYARRNGNPSAFEELRKLPDWLKEGQRLIDLFRPDRSTQPLFEFIVPFFKQDPDKEASKITADNPHPGKPPASKIPEVTWAVIRNYFGWILISLLLWCVPAYFAFHNTGTVPMFLGLVLSTLLGLGMAAILILFIPLRKLLTKKLPENFYGISRTFDPDESKTDAPLTNWLTSYLNTIAGKDLAKDGPLTFGDLHNAPSSPPEAGIKPPFKQGVNLEVMTTCINLGRPYRLPFREGDGKFFFCEEEFAEIFPKSVIETMKGENTEAPQKVNGKTLYVFPGPDHLPVVVGARMSLSFPLLISAVPLYKIDFTRHDRAEKPERCWFSDGGICSNLPIHFFDSPVPRWPTFGINLKQISPGHEKEEDRVWMPERPADGWQDLWNRFEEEGKFGSMLNFLSTLVDTMKDWRDTLLSRMPGYRDRLVHISLDDNEGGLNLQMSSATIENLRDFGRQAGEKILTHFDDHYNPSAAPHGWSMHRWTRFRSSLNVTEEWLTEMLSRLENPLAPDVSMDSSIPDHVNENPYPIRKKDEQEFIGILRELMSVARKMQSKADEIQLEERERKEPGGVYALNAPRPTPELRIRARI